MDTLGIEPAIPTSLLPPGSCQRLFVDKKLVINIFLIFRDGFGRNLVQRGLNIKPSSNLDFSEYRNSESYNLLKGVN